MNTSALEIFLDQFTSFSLGRSTEISRSWTVVFRKKIVRTSVL